MGKKLLTGSESIIFRIAEFFQNKLDSLTKKGGTDLGKGGTDLGKKCQENTGREPRCARLRPPGT